MQLTRITLIDGCIELVTGLHIGAGNEEMQIGGVDNPVIKNPVNRQPYIPGSSIKGKMRSLMEWRAGTVGDSEGKPIGFGVAEKLDKEKRSRAENILKLFGGAPEGSSNEEFIRRIGPGRLAFWDCPLDQDRIQECDRDEAPLTEIKTENTINRIRGAAENPRTNERVPAGARFDFKLTMRVHDDEDLLSDVLRGMHLIELTGLGGSGSRGYGKIRFLDLERDGKPIQSDYKAVRFDL